MLSGKHSYSMTQRDNKNFILSNMFFFFLKNDTFPFMKNVELPVFFFFFCMVVVDVALIVLVVQVKALARWKGSK